MKQWDSNAKNTPFDLCNIKRISLVKWQRNRQTISSCTVIPLRSLEVDFFLVLSFPVWVLSDAEEINVDKVPGSITVGPSDGANVDVEIVLTKQTKNKVK